MYVSNLPKEISKVELEAMFCRVGRIVDSFIPVDWTTRRKRGFGFVRFKFEKEASNAINIVTGRSWGGRLIRTHSKKTNRYPVLLSWTRVILTR